MALIQFNFDCGNTYQKFISVFNTDETTKGTKRNKPNQKFIMKASTIPKVDR